MNPTLFNLLSMFLLHAISLFVLCPSRFSFKKTLTLWGAATLLSIGIGAILLPTFRLAGAYASLIITIFLYVGAMLYASSYEAPKTIFLFFMYAQEFMVLVFLMANLITRFLFGRNFIALSIIRSVLHILIIILCATVFKRKFISASQGIKKGWWPLNLMSFFLLSYLCILIVHFMVSGYGNFEILLFILLLPTIVAVYWVFFHTISYMHNASEVERLELQSDFLTLQVATMQESMEAARRTNHDARHHNLQIAEYVHNGELAELLDYLNQYAEEALYHIPVNICENRAANNILNAYARKAEQSGIAVSFNVSMTQNIGIRDTDVVAMLANIMENAILGCIRSKAPEPFINMLIQQKSGKLVIESRNTTNDDAAFENGLPQSKTIQGTGISSILYSAHNYNGEADFQNDGGVFICRVLLKIPQKNALQKEI